MPMAYFHVLISGVTTPDVYRCIFVDLSESKLKSLILRPYRSGSPLVANGRVYSQSELCGIKIVRTETTSSNALATASAGIDKQFQELSRHGFPGAIGPFPSYGPDQIGEAGVDVTSQFITNSPGEGGRWKPVKAAFSNSWIIAIGGAVVATAIAKWLKLN